MRQGVWRMLIHGQEIGPGDIEEATFHWEASRFAGLCNSIIWADICRNTGSIPLLTGRIYVADNGEDAEWTGSARRGARKSGRFLRPGTNVFQYKKRSVSTTDRRTIVNRLRSALRGAIVDVEERTGKKVNNYLLLTNVDMTIEEQEAIRRTIKISHDNVNVEIMCAAQLAAALNSLPHLRSAYFVEQNFRTWESSWDAHTAMVLSGPSVNLVGRDESRNQINLWNNDPEVRAIILTGPHTIGKTRLALEATRERPFDFVEALGRHATLVSDLYKLIGPSGVITVFLDDPDPDMAQKLVREILGHPQLKLLLTIPTTDAIALPNFGYDPRARQLNIEPLDDDAARQLLRSVAGPLDYGLETWLTQMAGGVPGILIAAASVGNELREQPGDFTNKVASAIEAKARARLSNEQFLALKLFSSLSFVGVENDPQVEIQIICQNFSADTNSVLNAIKPLCATGFLRRIGSYVEVMPPLLANYLAEEILRSHAGIAENLFQRLEGTSLRRFLRRMVQLRGREISSFWSGLVRETGPFASLTALTENASLFHRCAVALPTTLAIQIADALAGTPIERRRDISGSARRDIVWGLQEMLLRRDTSEAALCALGELAEAENEDFGNNATGIFTLAFHPHNSQMPLALSRRLTTLRTFLSSTESDGRGKIALEACDTALRRTITMPLTPSTGNEPSGTLPTMTYGEYWAYKREILQLLIAATEDARDAVRRKAKAVLPSAAEALVAQGTLDEALSAFDTVLEQLLEEDYEFDVSVFGEALWRADTNLQVLIEAQPEMRRYRQRLAQQIEQLDRAPFSIRLRQHVGGWSFHDRGGDFGVSSLDRQAERIGELAQSVCAQPNLLDDKLSSWLLSASAQRRHEFWQQIGIHDLSRHWSDRMRQWAQNDDAAFSFQSYLLGWKTADAAAAASWFVHLANSERICALSILLGTLIVEPADTASSRITELLTNQSVEPHLAVRLIQTPDWLRQVSERSLLEVLAAIAGPSFENFGLLPEFINFRFYLRADIGPALAEFLWLGLESRPKLQNHNDDHYCETLAARLADHDPERGFALLDRYLRSGFDGRAWNPLWLGPRHEFWDKLCEIDRTRALITALEAVQANSRYIVGDLDEVIDLEADQATLLEFAVRGEDEAATVADAATQRKDGFWPLAFSLVEQYPTSQQVISKLNWGLKGMGGVIAGPMSEHLNRCLRRAELALNTLAPSAIARSWLEERIRSLREEIDFERRREADEHVNW